MKSYIQQAWGMFTLLIVIILVIIGWVVKIIKDFKDIFGDMMGGSNE
jgi:hypothetical protein